MTGLVKEKQSGARFKLDALVDAAFTPLQQLLGKKRWMLSDERASTLDCLALGYLSLALVPDMPQPWLAEGLRGRYPDLCKYAKDGAQKVFGGKVTPEDALLRSTTQLQSATTQGQRETTSLPWRAPEQQNVAFASASILHSILDSVPLYKRTTTVTTTSRTQPPPSQDATLTSTLLPPLLASAGAAAAIIASYLLYSGLTTMQEPSEKKRRLSDMGEAGAVFAGLDFGQSENVVGHLPVAGLEVDVDDGASEVRKL